MLIVCVSLQVHCCFCMLSVLCNQKMSCVVVSLIIIIKTSTKTGFSFLSDLKLGGFCSLVLES